MSMEQKDKVNCISILKMFSFLFVECSININYVKVADNHVQFFYVVIDFLITCSVSY